jgi:hypothetical protein
MSTSAPSRRPYHGSCHCGHTRYVCYLRLPPSDLSADAPIDTVQIKKCNCTTCHKFGFVHIRLEDAPNDFVLLSPTDPFTQLSDYQCASGLAHFFFCGTCGVRTFIFGLYVEQGEKVQIDLEAWLGQESQGKMTEVWRPKKEGYAEEKTAMLRVNATSLDARQEGVDLGEWHEKGWIAYAERLEEKNETRMGKPYPGGMY